MSGPKTAGYQLSADRLAQLHAAREAERQRALEEARLRAAQQQWQAVALRHHALKRRAGRIATRDAPAVHIEELPAPGTTSAQIQAAAQAATALIARLDAELAGQEREARDARVRADVADVLRGRAAPPRRAPRAARQPAAGTLAEDGARSDDLARCTRLLGRLDPEAEPTPELTALAEHVRAEDAGPQARRAVLARLQEGVDVLNRACRERRVHAEARSEAEAVLAQTGDEALRAALLTDPDTAALRAATEAAVARDRTGREDAFVEEVVLDVLRTAGFTVMSGFTVHTPHQGVLVRRDRDPASHGVEVRIGGGAVGVEAVRLGSGGPRTPADLQAERELCAVVPQVWDALDRHDARVHQVRAMPVGAVVPKLVPGPAVPAPDTPAPRPEERPTDAVPSRPRPVVRPRLQERRMGRS